MIFLNPIKEKIVINPEHIPAILVANGKAFNEGYKVIAMYDIEVTSAEVQDCGCTVAHAVLKERRDPDTIITSLKTSQILSYGEQCNSHSRFLEYKAVLYKEE